MRTEIKKALAAVIKFEEKVGNVKRTYAVKRKKKPQNIVRVLPRSL